MNKKSTKKTDNVVSNKTITKSKVGLLRHSPILKTVLCGAIGVAVGIGAGVPIALKVSGFFDLKTKWPTKMSFAAQQLRVTDNNGTYEFDGVKGAPKGSSVIYSFGDWTKTIPYQENAKITFSDTDHKLLHTKGTYKIHAVVTHKSYLKPCVLSSNVSMTPVSGVSVHPDVTELKHATKIGEDIKKWFALKTDYTEGMATESDVEESDIKWYKKDNSKWIEIATENLPTECKEEDAGVYTFTVTMSFKEGKYADYILEKGAPENTVEINLKPHKVIFKTNGTCDVYPDIEEKYEYVINETTDHTPTEIKFEIMARQGYRFDDSGEGGAIDKISVIEGGIDVEKIGGGIQTFYGDRGGFAHALIYGDTIYGDVTLTFFAIPR